MERKVIDLEIVDELEGSGVDAIALVDTPAIEKNFMYFRQEKFVEPKAGESESDYMGRCVPVLIGEGKEQDQAVAICISTYENMSIDTSALPTYVDETGKKKEEFASEEYPTIEEAQARSEELGLNGEIHSHATDNGFIYMPGASHEDLEKALAELEIDFASVDELSVGDDVSWKTADKNPRGKITEIVKGAKKVPGVDFEIQGTEEDPGYIIEIYEEVDGKWEPSGKYVGRKADSILKNVSLSKVLEFAKTAGFVAEDFTTNGLQFDEDSETIDLKLAKGYTVYKYTGSVGSDTRAFCREMVGMDRFYTFEEIEAMGDMAVNPGFGLGGASTYSIWEYKGGPNCKHRWTKFYINESGNPENKGAAPGIAGEKPNNMANNGYAFAAIEDKMELVGPVAIPDIKIPRKDKNGNVYLVRFSKEVVRRMAEKFMREQKLAESNIQHDGEQDGKSYVYESWIIEHPEDKANSVYNLNLPVGSWVIKMRVTDAGVWKKVKAGEVKGFSLEGSFMDKQDWEQYQKDREIYNKVIRILKNS